MTDAKNEVLSFSPSGYSQVEIIAVREVPPLLLAFLRNCFASLILLPLYLIRKKKKSEPPLPGGRIFVMGLAGITLFYALFNISLVYTTASAGSLIQAMGYFNFYLLTTVIAIPGVILFWSMIRSGLVDVSIGSAGREETRSAG